VTDFQRLYGKEHMSFNVHQTLHLVQSVKDWWPLWSHSAFVFESFNAVLLKMIKGTQGVPKQILSTFCLTRAIPQNVRSVLPHCSDNEAQFIEALTTHTHKIRCAVTIENEITVLGQPVCRALKRSHFVAMHSLAVNVPQTVVSYYNRVIHRGEVYHCYEYCLKLKRNSYTVQLVDGQYYHVDKYVCMNLGNGNNCYALGRYFRQVPYQICRTSCKLIHIVPVSKVLSALVAIPVTDILCKCKFISASQCDVNLVCGLLHQLDYCS
jgi:hypothetical protein